MAIRGITGALLAGPIEAPDLNPLPFQEIVAFQGLQDQRREAAMEDISSLQTNLNLMGSIPGTEEIGKYITQPYEDKLEQIYNKYDGNLTRMAPEVQALEFDFRTRMTDDMRSYQQSVLNYNEQAARLQKGIADKTYDPETAGRLFNMQTLDYANALNNYNAGIGPRPSSTMFNRTPFETPDFLNDMDKIMKNFTPSQIATYGNLVKRGKPDANGNPVYYATDAQGVTTTEYSDREARQIAAENYLMSLPNYVNWAREQVDLGVRGMPYTGTEDPVDSLMSIYKAKPGSQEETLLRQRVTQELKILADQGYDPEQAQQILGKQYHSDLQKTNVIRNIASGAGEFAFQKTSITNVTQDDDDVTQPGISQVGSSIDLELPAPDTRGKLVKDQQDLLSQQKSLQETLKDLTPGTDEANKKQKALDEINNNGDLFVAGGDLNSVPPGSEIDFCEADKCEGDVCDGDYKNNEAYWGTYFGHFEGEPDLMVPLYNSYDAAINLEDANLPNHFTHAPSTSFEKDSVKYDRKLDYLFTNGSWSSSVTHQGAWELSDHIAVSSYFNFESE